MAITLLLIGCKSICSWILYMVWDRGSTSNFAWGYPVLMRLFVKKTILSSLNYLNISIKNQLPISMKFVLGIQFKSIDLYVYSNASTTLPWCNFVEGLKLGSVSPPALFFLLKGCWLFYQGMCCIISGSLVPGRISGMAWPKAQCTINSKSCNALALQQEWCNSEKDVFV